MGCKVTGLQNKSSWCGETPTIKITIDSPEWEEAFKNWNDGKNPTESPEWKKGVFAQTQWSRNALEFLFWCLDSWFIPSSLEKPNQPPSRSEIRRWLDKKSVEINGKFPGQKDDILLPITSLVFFPKGKMNKCTFF